MIISISGKIGSGNEILEEWKDIKGYEKYYQISNLGNIKRFAGKCLAKNNSYRRVSERIITPFPNKTRGNYFYVNLVMYGVSQQYRIHILVAKHFLSNPENKPEVNHKDDNKKNNFINNLEWVTSSENKIKAYETKIMQSGEKHYNSKLSNKDIIDIRISNESNEILAKKYNVTKTHIVRIINNKRRNHG